MMENPQTWRIMAIEWRNLCQVYDGGKVTSACLLIHSCCESKTRGHISRRGGQNKVSENR
jgi:hypothetical protein